MSTWHRRVGAVKLWTGRTKQCSSSENCDRVTSFAMVHLWKKGLSSGKQFHLHKEVQTILYSTKAEKRGIFSSSLYMVAIRYFGRDLTLVKIEVSKKSQILSGTVKQPVIFPTLVAMDRIYNFPFVIRSVFETWLERIQFLFGDAENLLAWLLSYLKLGTIFHHWTLRYKTKKRCLHM